jgi:hypothetical protein
VDTTEDHIGGCNCRAETLFENTHSMAPRFSEMNKVRVICEQFGKFEGYVPASQFRGDIWIYKISISEALRAQILPTLLTIGYRRNAWSARSEIA